jgi:hypothetical protein
MRRKTRSRMTTRRRWRKGRRIANKKKELLERA